MGRVCGEKGPRHPCSCVDLSEGGSVPVERVFAGTMHIGPGQTQGRAILASAAPPCSGTDLIQARLCPETTLAQQRKVPPREGPAPRAACHSSRLRCQQEIMALYLDGFSYRVVTRAPQPCAGAGWPCLQLETAVWVSSCLGNRASAFPCGEETVGTCFPVQRACWAIQSPTLLFVPQFLCL